MSRRGAAGSSLSSSGASNLKPPLVPLEVTSCLVEEDLLAATSDGITEDEEQQQRNNNNESAGARISDDDEDHNNNITMSLTPPTSGELSDKIRHWQESPYAVGLVDPTWSRVNAQRGCTDCCSEEIEPESCGCHMCSGLVCFPFKRVGNMVVFRETFHNVDEYVSTLDGKQQQQGLNETPDDVMHHELSSASTAAAAAASATFHRRVRRKPKIQFVVGPYWPMLAFVTWPLVLGVSFMTAYTVIPYKGPFITFLWLFCTVSLILALFFVSCRDPGILYRQRTEPINNNILQWRWNDQAQTYRPRGAVYDPDCAVVVEGFDHTCPWTGTAIGKKNMGAFQCFVGMIFVCLILDIMLLSKAL